MDREGKIKIGIDPGVHTGFAVSINGKLTHVMSLSFWAAIDEILKINEGRNDLELEVVIEDVTKNRPTFNRYGAKYGAKRDKTSQNVGMNKAYCKLMMEFFDRNFINYTAIKPTKYSMTKLSSDKFKKITGWVGRTNEHGRDAAMLIFE